MSATRFSSSHRGLTPLLLAFALGVGLTAIVGSLSDASGNYGVSGLTTEPCQDGSDVIASMDRSRNGVPLTCNSDTLSEGAAE